MTNVRTQDRTGSWEKIKCKKCIDYRIDESTGITTLFYVLSINFLSKTQLHLCKRCVFSVYLKILMSHLYHNNQIKFTNINYNHHQRRLFSFQLTVRNIFFKFGFIVLEVLFFIYQFVIRID